MVPLQKVYLTAGTPTIGRLVLAPTHHQTSTTFDLEVAKIGIDDIPIRSGRQAIASGGCRTLRPRTFLDYMNTNDYCRLR